MRFAADIWLWGALFSLLLAGILVLQGFRLSRDRARFGDVELIGQLLTARTGLRRAIRGVLSCLAVALLFIAAAQPQYGKGTRILPATNLDVVLVLDYSKSMYARDVSPSRIGRAKIEMGHLIRELSGARFAAVAFAGESISFPLTSDGSAIAQFFRGMEPNDLPVGGTAIARALESGRQLLERDPLSKNHERVMILVTDGEDLEGDPVAVAQSAHQDGIRIDVVQIGGASPEPIPDVDEHGVSRGMRRDSQGQIMTTQLTAEGQAQLASVAREGGGTLVQAAQGEVGIDEMTAELRRLMSEELSERVETVFADVYHYPLTLGVVLLLLEALIGAAPKHTPRRLPPKGTTRRRRPRRLKSASATAALLCLLSLGCDPIDELFTRQSPTVNEAISALKENNPQKSAELLIEYLETGPCEAGVIGAGDRTRQMGDASLDLALAFSQMARSASETTNSSAPSPGQVPSPGIQPDPASPPPQVHAASEATSSIDCGLRVLAPLSGNATLAPELRARAHYLAGNLEMLREGYEAAVAAYDQALLLSPGVAKEAAKKPPFEKVDVDPLGLWIAENRALALRLQKEKEEQERKQQEENQSNQDEQEQQDKQDQSKDQQEPSEDEQNQKDDQQDDQDQSKDQQEPSEDEQNQEDSPGDQDPQDQEENPPESSPEDGDEQQPTPEEEEASQEERESQASANDQPSEARDQRMLDLLEQAPTLQQHNAEERSRKGVRVRSTMEDK